MVEELLYRDAVVKFVEAERLRRQEQRFRAHGENAGREKTQWLNVNQPQPPANLLDPTRLSLAGNAKHREMFEGKRNKKLHSNQPIIATTSHALAAPHDSV